MTKSKIRRCDAPGCRTLTAAGLCEQHREAEQAPLQATIDADAKHRARIVELEAGLAKAREWEKRVEHIDRMRADLDGLRLAAQQTDRRAEVPTFSGELP